MVIRLLLLPLPQEIEQILLKLGGVLEKADYVICGDEVVNSKPDPEIFLKAAEKLE